jgi:hypothetical protein
MRTILISMNERTNWLSSRERMVGTLDALATALTPVPTCPACRATLADVCPECTQARADLRAVNRAIAAVEVAATEAAALTAYQACLLGLALAVPVRRTALA